ncbi:hypothetical protein JXA12_02220 [Candidatus Woesearchaeota archaeon]|nr:hypothetical protein [Candidatus Woesearchaeota archaeon]
MKPIIIAIIGLAIYIAAFIVFTKNLKGSPMKHEKQPNARAFILFTTEYAIAYTTLGILFPNFMFKTGILNVSAGLIATALITIILTTALFAFSESLLALSEQHKKTKEEEKNRKQRQRNKTKLIFLLILTTTSLSAQHEMTLIHHIEFTDDLADETMCLYRVHNPLGVEYRVVSHIVAKDDCAVIDADIRIRRRPERWAVTIKTKIETRSLPRPVVTKNHYEVPLEFFDFSRPVDLMEWLDRCGGIRINDEGYQEMGFGLVEAF